MLTIFVDESCADGKNRYLIHGALFIKDSAIEPIRDRIAEICEEDGIPDEVKWSGISRRSLERDMKVSDVFFFSSSRPEGCPPPQFQCMVVDQHRVNARAFHDGDRDLCFYKLLYQLLLNRIPKYANPGEAVHVVLDQRSTRKYDLNELRTVLRRGLRKNLGEHCPDVCSVSYENSKLDRLLQLSDLLTGAVGFHQNGLAKRAGISAAKLEAASQISKKAGMMSLDVHTRWDLKFGIWSIRLRESRH